MLNWPHHGNDYGVGLNRLIQSESKRREFLQEAYWHSQSFARFLQTQLGRRYGLAETLFPQQVDRLGGGAFALHPYYRESRRLRGLVTVREQDILPLPGGRVARLPIDEQGRSEAIALGNYANDHHYPDVAFSVQPKSIRWGGRYTGTPFALPYRCLIPADVDGLLVCEKNSSVSHVANGATRLQPIVLGMGQAAGMAAALCVEYGCQPRDLPVEMVQAALLEDPIAPMAIVPLFNLLPHHPDWLPWQCYYLNDPSTYPADGYCSLATSPRQTISMGQTTQAFVGIFERRGEQDYRFTLTEPIAAHPSFSLVTLDPDIDRSLQGCITGELIRVLGKLNRSGNWLLVDYLWKEQTQ